MNKNKTRKRHAMEISILQAHLNDSLRDVDGVTSVEEGSRVAPGAVKAFPGRAFLDIESIDGRIFRVEIMELDPNG